MRIEQYLIAMLLGGLVVFIGFVGFGSMISNYGLTNANQSRFDGTYDVLERIHNDTKGIQEDVRDQGINQQTTESSMFAGAFKAMKSAWTSISLSGKVMGEISTEATFGDSENTQMMRRIFGTFTIIVGILFLASLIYMVFRFQPR